MRKTSSAGVCASFERFHQGADQRCDEKHLSLRTLAQEKGDEEIDHRRPQHGPAVFHVKGRDLIGGPITANKNPGGDDAGEGDDAFYGQGREIHAPCFANGGDSRKEIRWFSLRAFHDKGQGNLISLALKDAA